MVVGSTANELGHVARSPLGIQRQFTFRRPGLAIRLARTPRFYASSQIPRLAANSSTAQRSNTSRDSGPAMHLFPDTLTHWRHHGTSFFKRGAAENVQKSMTDAIAGLPERRRFELLVICMLCLYRDQAAKRQIYLAKYWPLGLAKYSLYFGDFIPTQRFGLHGTSCLWYVLIFQRDGPQVAGFGKRTSPTCLSSHSYDFYSTSVTVNLQHDHVHFLSWFLCRALKMARSSRNRLSSSRFGYGG